MLLARRLSDNKKVFGNIIDKDVSETYICDYCKKMVIHHKSTSKIKLGHFKHKPNESDCPNQRNGETEYHLKTKYDIYNYIEVNWGNKLKIIEVEKWICNNTIRSDIYLETKKNKIAIEIQTTFLTVFEIKERTVKYTANDIYVLWILPYNYSRFYEYILDLDNKYDWFLINKVRLKEMEIFLYWSYNQHLFFWDLTHKYSDDFICILFNEYKNDDVEFIRDGEEHNYLGKIAKTIKRPIYEINVRFDKMITKDLSQTDVKNRQYKVPSRKLFTYK